jgi:hypothetical protein
MDIDQAPPAASSTAAVAGASTRRIRRAGRFLQLEHHYSPIRVGIAFLAWTGVSPFVAPIAGADRSAAR